jgi:hypothetical protein
MAATYEEALRTGGGRVEYVFHVHGFPWAVCTHPAVGALISDVANSCKIYAVGSGASQRGEMFGFAEPIVAGTPFFPADDVVITHGLQPPGSQTFKLSATQGLVEVGGWSVEIAHREYGLTLPHRPDNPCFGLEGLHTVPDPRTDGTISHASLERALLVGDTALYLDGDSDHGIADLVTANLAAGLPTYLWIGHEVVAVTAMPVGSYTVERGVWRSREQSHFLDDHDGCPILVADAPIGGATSRPCTLWAVLVDDDCTEVLDLALARTGRVSTKIRSERGMTSVDCDGWTDWLRTPIKNRSFSAPLKGYVFSRPSASADALSDAAGHFVYYEYDAVPAIQNPVHVWLCAAGTSVYFETYEDVVDAFNMEMVLIHTGLSVINPGVTSLELYQIKENKICATGFNGPSWCTGILPWLFDWHGWRVGAEYWSRVYDEIRGINHWLENDWYLVTSRSFIDGLGGLNGVITLASGCYDWTGATLPTFVLTGILVPPSATTSPTMCVPSAMLHVLHVPYCYQWPWDVDAFAEAANGSETDLAAVLSWSFPIPLHPTHADYRLEINEEYDASVMAAGDIVRFGPKDTTGVVASSGVDHIVLDVDPPDYVSDWDNTTPVIFFDWSTSPQVRKGGLLTPVPFSPTDQFALAFDPVGEADSAFPWLLLSAGLGNVHATARWPQRFQADHVPDALYEAAAEPTAPLDQYPTIDWVSFSTCFQRISPTETYRMPLPPDAEVMFSAALEGFCLSHGVSPTWEFDRYWHMWRMRFRQIGVLNATEAMLSGRELDQTNIKTTKQVIEHTRTNQYNRVEYSGCWNGTEFLAQITADSQSAYAWTGSKKATLAIKDYATQLPQPEVLMSDYEAMTGIKAMFAMTLLSRLAQPAPTVTVDLAPSVALRLGCGTTATITDDTIRDPNTDAFGVTDRAALVTEFRQHLYGKQHTAVLQLGAAGSYGYVPSLSVTQAQGVVVDANTVDITVGTDPTLNEFQPPNLLLTDLGYFDCLTLTGEPRGCGCGDYLVIITERYSTAPVAFGNVVISDVDIVAGTATLTGVGLGAAWAAIDEWVLVYEFWDSALEPCQRKWLYHADEDQNLVDGFGVSTIGRSWT